MLYLIQVFHGAPTLSNKATLGDVQVKLVHGVIDCLDLGDLKEGGGRREEGEEEGKGERRKKREERENMRGFSGERERGRAKLMVSV